MKQLLLTLIRIYQKTKFFHSSIARSFFLTDRVCRFTPTCSEYTYQAIKKYGAFLGSWVGLGRIIRCHPWNPGGYDPLK